jgi:amino acid transporter
MGGEVKNPKRTIPGSCIITCLVVLVICIAVYISVIGVLPWYEIKICFVANETL